MKDAVIVRLDGATRMLAEAKTMQQAKQIMDMADAAKVYAKRQKLGEEAVAYANSIQFVAMRKLGEIMEVTPKNKGARALFNTGGSCDDPPATLSQIGINKHVANKIRQVAKLPQSLFEQVKDGVLGLAEAVKNFKKKNRQAEIRQQKQQIESGKAVLPEGVFEVVVMDPPWNYGREYDPQGSRVANPYPEMKQDELLKLRPPFAKDCVLFLWTTHAFIWDAKQLLDHWGFNYKATLVWDKEKIGIGKWLRMQCEFCLVSIKGKPAWDNTTWRDLIREPRREHSRKPNVFYRMVEEITAGRRLDYFSREQRKGWSTFGNDEQKFSN